MTRSIASSAGANHRPSLLAVLERAAAGVTHLGPEFGPDADKLNGLRQRLAEGRYHLAVLGQFKRGKSTLLNALMGEPILPVSVVPLTAVPTFIQFHAKPMVHVHYRDGRGVDKISGLSTRERSEYLARFVTEEGNPQNKLGVTEVEVLLPAPILAGGVVLIDTPGIGSTYRHNTVATMNFLQQCDAALFLISADPPITEVELEFLREVQKKIPRLFYVLNKIDYLDPAELEQALAFLRQVLAEHTGANDQAPVFCISARRGLEARMTGDGEKYGESGVAQLENFLGDFLAAEKFAALSEAVARRAQDSLEVVLMEAGIALQALKLPQQALKEKIALFEESLKRAARERELIQDVLEGDKKRVTCFLEEQARALAQEAARVLKDIMYRGPGPKTFGKSAKDGIQEAWADAIPEFFEQQQAALNESVKTRLLECLAPHEQRLGQLVETLRQTAADLFQVPYRPLSPDDALEIKRRPYWVLNTWNTDPLPLLKSMDQRLDELVRRNVENIRWSMLQNLTISFASFARKAKERLDETVAATKGAMEAARVRRETHGETVETQVRHLNGCIAELENIRAGLDGFKPKS